MPAPFAALDARLNRAVIDHLANAEAVFAEGTVSVEFGRDEEDMPATLGAPRQLGEWIIGAPIDDFAGIDYTDGKSVSIGGVEYKVTGSDLDASGWQTLMLRRA